MVDVTTHGFRVVPPEEEYDPLVLEAARAHGVDPALVRAVIRAESRYDPRAVSPRGARGLMQLMPRVARELGVTDAFDPRQNVFDRHDGDVVLALASYNAGPTNVKRYGGVPPFRETQGYLAKIRRDMRRARHAALRTDDLRPSD
jgi:soluble lytic murein transglycosylase-like protein